ncbi:MAG: sulfurtransferase TusA family protein [Saccharospirillaceae bacterium]|nr:sulfurtransferase TusA family protein [Pseudomonadales bacterium]NRB80747.1 sulfurtransferase TusA family protein [Saccharospirillaceae bacterium]
MKELDFTGQRCPLPLLKMKQALIEATSNELLKVMTSDEGSLRDIPLYLSRTKHTLLKQDQQNGIYHFIIEVGSKHD